MTTVARNDPCPCGSGRKFKKCCLWKTDAPPEAFTRDEREAARDRLARFSARDEFADVPPQIQDRLVGELYERHYRDWPEQARPRAREPHA